MTAASRTISIVLFDGFELLDVFGPVELLSRVADDIEVVLLGPAAGSAAGQAASPAAGPAAGPVRSSQGTEVVATRTYADAAASGDPDIVMVPGGMGTRMLAADPGFLRWLGDWAGRARLVTSVCTGSALLAAAGLLEGYRATSNKRAFAWASTHGTDVRWAPSARWVHDRDRWTSSGVAAGMDMAAALIADLLGPDAAARAADEIELEVRTDPDRDPFAVTPSP